MEISVNIKELQQYKVLVATPMYGGSCHGFYMNSCLQLQNLANQMGLNIGFTFLFNESLITRARNYLAETFRSSPENFTHLLFLDSDIEFNPRDVVTALAVHHLDKSKNIICAPYPKKNISWEKVKQAVDAGIADENPNELSKYVGDFVIGVAGTGQTEIDLSHPVEVTEAGTGFMLISRKVFDDYAAAFPELLYTPDHARSEGFDGSKKIVCFFDTVIDPETNRYLSEDYYFCKNARKIGHKTWILPWVKLNHVGMYKFDGDLLAIAGIGASLTVNKEQLKKRGK